MIASSPSVLLSARSMTAWICNLPSGQLAEATLRQDTESEIGVGFFFEICFGAKPAPNSNSAPETGTYSAAAAMLVSAVAIEAARTQSTSPRFGRTIAARPSHTRYG